MVYRKTQLNELFRASHELVVGSVLGEKYHLYFSKALPQHFTITRKSRFAYSVRVIDGSWRFFVDSVELTKGEHEDISQPCFIAARKNDQHFLIGFDPSGPGMWEIQHRGAVVKIQGVTKDFEGARERGLFGLRNVQLSIRQGEFVGIYGKSGAGKSTLLESILGITNPTAGSVWIDHQTPEKAVREGMVAYLPQHVELPRALKCIQLLKLAAATRGVSFKEAHEIGWSWFNVLLDLAGLSTENDFLNKPIQTLSGGQYRRLCLALAIMRPYVPLLVVDEPTAGLDPSNEHKMFMALKRLSRVGTTVVVVTHAPFARRYFDRVIILRRVTRSDQNSIRFDAQWDDNAILEWDPRLRYQQPFERFIWAIEQDEEGVSDWRNAFYSFRDLLGYDS